MQNISLLLFFISLVACGHSQKEYSHHCDNLNTENVKIRDSLKKTLSDNDFAITCNAKTEPAFTGKYWNHKENGIYHCKICNALLFNSTHKYESGSGWPSFYNSINEKAIKFKEDNSHNMKRIEIKCSNCNSHLGHIFNDGPMPTGKRYCVNSASLNFNKKNK